MRTIRDAILLVINYFFLNIPSHTLRIFYLKRILGKLGDGSTFLRGCEIRNPKNIYIGDNCVINKNTLLDGRGGEISIGNNVDIAQETNIWSLEHDPHSDYHNSRGADVIIKDYVWIASRVTILPGLIIGAGAVVACNSVVTKDVPKMSIVGGIPAKMIGIRKSKLKYTLNYRPKFK